MGDYCGIPLKARVVAFPYDVVDHPMYLGMVLSYLGMALLILRPAAFLLTVWLGVCLGVAALWEGQFTRDIYRWVAKGKQKVAVE